MEPTAPNDVITAIQPVEVADITAPATESPASVSTPIEAASPSFHTDMLTSETTAVGTLSLKPRDRIANTINLYDIVDGDNVVGRIQIGFLPARRLATFDVKVDPQFQQQGMGTKVFAEVGKYMHDNGYTFQTAGTTKESRGYWTGLVKKGLAKVVYSDPNNVDSAEYEYQSPVKAFKTAKGSVYTRQPDNRYTRHKTVTGESFSPRDLTVFVKPSPQDRQLLLDAIHTVSSPGKARLYIIERQPDNTSRIVRNMDEIADASRLYMATIREENGQSVIVLNLHCSLTPTVGWNEYDATHFKDASGQTVHERHLGNQVAEIEYE